MQNLAYGNIKCLLNLNCLCFIKHNLIIMLSYSDGTFYLWETNTWTSEQWSSTSGFVKVREVYMLVLVLYGYLFTLRQHLFLNFVCVFRIYFFKGEN